MLLWTSEAVQSDQAFTSFKILLPPFCEKWHGCKVGAVTSLDYSLVGTLSVVHVYVTICFILCPHLCAHVRLSLCPSRLFLPFSPTFCLSALSALSSEFSEVVDLFTSCSVPLPPFPPELEMAGVTWLCLKWQRPTSSPKEDDIYYILEMEEEGSVCLFFFFLRQIIWDRSPYMTQRYLQQMFSVKYIFSPLCEVLAAVDRPLVLRGHHFDFSSSSESMKYVHH